MSKHENETGVIVSIRLERSDAAVVFSSLNAVDQEEQDSLVPRARLVPAEAADQLPAGLV